jgi:hypothetical protein
VLQSGALPVALTRAFRSTLASLALLTCVVCSPAAAAPPQGFSFRRDVKVGKPPRSAALVVKQGPDASIVLEVERVHAVLAITEPERAEVQLVTLANGGNVAVLRVNGAGGREAAAIVSRDLQGHAQISWTGALDLRGDPGERTGTAIEVRVRSGEPQSDLVVAELDETTRICGQSRTLLHARTLDPSTLQLQPVASSRLAVALPAEVELAASAQSPGPKGPPLLRSLGRAAVSTGSGAMTALTDGSAATYWSAGSAALATGEFASFRRDGGGFAIRAFAVTPLPAGLPGGNAVVAPRALWLVGDDGARIRVKLPDAPAAGARYFAVPPKPLAWRCLSVVIDDVAPPSANQAAQTVLAEIEAYTDLDFGGGIDRLLAELAGGGPAAGDAAHLLGSLGPEVAAKLQAAWPKLSAAARRRAVQALGGAVEQQQTARNVIALALDDEDADVSKAASALLLEGGPSARAVLVARVAKADASGDAAALALARKAPREAINALLNALAASGGHDRRALREAIARACQDGGDPVVATTRAWLAAPPASAAERAIVARVLSRMQQPESARKLSAEIVAADAPTAKDFEQLWRLASAARALSPEPSIDAWLARLAKEDEHWMVRSEALAALAERGSAQHLEVASAALESDPYPRVRIAASSVLAKEPSALGVLAKHAGRDSWPMVRAASLEALASQAGAEQVLRAGLADRAHQVRAAAIRALTTAGARAAWPMVEQRLKDKDEWPEVVSEGVRFARALCIEGAAGALLDLLRKGIRADAFARDADVGLLAFEALAQLGGEPARAATAVAGASTAPEVFRSAVRTQASRKPECALSNTAP